MMKICFITSARSEYGLLKWLMKEAEGSAYFELQIVVTGGHLLKEQGYTVEYIREDGFSVDAEVDVSLDTTSKQCIAASMGRMAEELSIAFGSLKPDYVVVLGDRYELLPICDTAFVMGIPIIHISGGDVTEGAIDNGIRNAVTMLATYHFPGTLESADNIIRMRGSDKGVWAVGEPGLDAFKRYDLLSKYEISEELGLNINKKWVLMTYHPETNSCIEKDLKVVENCCDILIKKTDIQIIATYANADFGGQDINKYLESVSLNNPEKFKTYASLGNKNYLSLMKCVAFIIGNSSSGIVEAPSLEIPVVNIGNRQKGRYLCGNVIQSDSTYEAIKVAIEKAENHEIDTSDAGYWGDGHTAERIISILENNL